MDVDALLGMYATHDTLASPPPEGSPENVKYTMCCINANCKGGSIAACGDPPNLMGMRLFDAEMPSMTKPAGIMMLAACAAAFVMAATGIACMAVRMRRSSRAQGAMDNTLE